MMATDDVSSSRRAEEIPLPPSPTSFSTDHEGGRQYPHEVPIPNPSIENGSNGTEGGHQVPETTLDPSGIKGEQKRVAKTTADKSWEIMMKEVTRYDEDTVKGWKEEIDTLLVFAGLFSAVVTAFAIESYQWLDDDPEDTTVALLKQISQQLSNPTNASQVPSPSPFEVDSSSIRINCFWFLSLIFSLTSGLFALLCKQWLREYRRDTPTRTQAEALALRQLRSESLEKWRVSSFISALPIFLEIALFLFFAGLLELLWTLHWVAFMLSVLAIGFGVGLYLVTSALPTIAAPALKNEQWEQISTGFQYICSYKSPQAWAVYRLISTLLAPLAKLGNRVGWLPDRLWSLGIRTPASDWSSFDLDVVRRFDTNPHGFPNDSEQEEDPINLRVYELRGLQWATTVFRDSPSMLPHLRNVLSTLHPSVALSAILGHWHLPIWSDCTVSDVHAALSDPEGFRAAKSSEIGNDCYYSRKLAIADPVLLSPAGIEFMYQQQAWLASALKANEIYDVANLESQIGWYMSYGTPQMTGLRFLVPFSIVDRLWTHPEAEIRKVSMSFLRFFETSWKAYPGREEDMDERFAFLHVLSKHINCTDPDRPPSELLFRSRGHTFIQFINSQIIRHRLYWARWDVVDAHDRAQLMAEWRKATQRVQEIGGLPLDYFATIPSMLTRRGENLPQDVLFPPDFYRNPTPDMSYSTNWQNTYEMS